MLKKHMGLTTLRVWLMYGVFAHDADGLHRDMGKFLDIAAASNISVGFVFFGDCFNHAGGSATQQCVPKKGVHNGCWMASPQDAERVGANASNGYAPLKSYVTSTITKFKDHPSVVMWEIFNEPRRDAYSLGLRNAGYEWAKALRPSAPVLALWDDNNNTDVVDHHDYGTGFKSTWAPALYGDPAKGAIVTEGGSRWFQPDPGPATSAKTNQADQGSPLTVINFFAALRAEKKAGKVPYVPGAIICWEAMVGNSNTRWHWGTAPNSAEPAIPWDAWMFPDGTPISYTEVAAFRRYATDGKVDDFARFDDFLPFEKVQDGDVTHTLPAGATYTASHSHSHSHNSGDGVGVSAGCEEVAGSCMGECPAGMGCGSDGHGCVCKVAPIMDGVYETTFWATWPGDGNMTMIVSANPLSIHVDASDQQQQQQASITSGGGDNDDDDDNSAADVTEDDSGSGSSCSQDKSKVYPGYDIAGADYKGIDYRTLDISAAAIAHNDSGVSTCSAACCAWEGCGAWIVQSGTGASTHDHNCTKDTTTCCWLKPNANGAHTPNAKSIAGVVTASPARPVMPPPPPPPPPGPPSPHNVSGYHVVLIGATKTLVVERRAPTTATAAGTGSADAEAAATTAGTTTSSVLGSFDLSTLENGLVLEAWNILRVVVETVESSSGEIEGVQLSVYFNPMFPETGFVGNASDAHRVPQRLAARLVVMDKHPLGAGELMVSAGLRDTMIDYIAAMPTSVL
jgi:hypothetical protein